MSTDERFCWGGIRRENRYLRGTGGLVLRFRGPHVEQLSFTNWPPGFYVDISTSKIPAPPMLPDKLRYHLVRSWSSIKSDRCCSSLAALRQLETNLSWLIAVCFLVSFKPQQLVFKVKSHLLLNAALIERLADSRQSDKQFLEVNKQSRQMQCNTFQLCAHKLRCFCLFVA